MWAFLASLSACAAFAAGTTPDDRVEIWADAGVATGQAALAFGIGAGMREGPLTLLGTAGFGGRANLFQTGVSERPGFGLATLAGALALDKRSAISAVLLLDAALLDTAERGKDRWGTLAYVRAGIVESRRRAPFALQVHVDDHVVHDGEATGVLVANIGRLRAGVEALPDANPHDGLLDVAVITASGARAWMALMTSAVLHRQQLSGHVEITQGAEVVIELAAKHRFELDGGVKGKVRRLEIGVRPSSLVVCG